MGQEITHEHFTEQDREAFRQRLEAETRLLREQFDAGLFSSEAPVAGFEIEGWLVDDAMRPNPVNQEFLQQLNNPLATPELARFNIELNIEPLALGGSVLSAFEKRLQQLYQAADEAAEKANSHLLLTGILPTLKAEDCSLRNMSSMKRYAALNEEIAKARSNAPIELDIDGVDHIHISEQTVMLEAATTSLQLHLQTPCEQAHRHYNASIVASAPLLAVAVNSPFLFGRELWQESRISVFEQSVDTGTRPQRVSFGSGYARGSIVECFEENLNRYPVLLPELMTEGPEHFAHLRLHNGAIWRWNRPLIGFDSDGVPHVRIEQRVLPAGPTLKDMIANAAFYYGLAIELEARFGDDEIMSFAVARENFYRVAKTGLDTEISWGRKNHAVARLILDELLPLAESGLQRLHIGTADSKQYLGVIAARAESGQTGAQWQIDHARKYDKSMQALTADYLQRQKSSVPVHEWDH
jgi:hypothetical protein